MNVIIVGDSYAFGHGCSDRECYIDPVTGKLVGSMEIHTMGFPPSNNCWGSLLQKNYPGLNVINLAKSGDSNTRMVQRLFSELERTKPDFIIFSGTGVFRMATANWNGPGGEQQANWVLNDPRTNNVPPHISKAREHFLRYMFSPEVFISNSMMAIYAIHGIAQQYGAKCMWSLPVGDKCYGPERDVSTLDGFASELKFNLDAINGTRFIPHLEYLRTVGPEGLAPDSHFNDFGHFKYYNEVILPKFKELTGL